MTSIILYNNNQNQETTKKKNSLWSKPTENQSKSLWDDENKTFTPLPYDSFPIDCSINSFEILIRKTRLIDINKRIKSEDWEEKENRLIRSPSPEPEYDKKTNIRLNTFNNRMKKRYLIEKNSIIEELIILDSSFKPPVDYVPNEMHIKLSFINTKQHNISSLIIGPEGRTLIELQRKLKCKLKIDNDKEALLVYSSNKKDLEQAKDYLLPLLDPFSKEHIHFKNEKRKEFEMKLGIKSLNQHGGNGFGCENCGDKGHSTWACLVSHSEVDIICEVCGDKGHITFDCKLKDSHQEKEKENEEEIVKDNKDISSTDIKIEGNSIEKKGEDIVISINDINKEEENEPLNKETNENIIHKEDDLSKNNIPPSQSPYPNPNPNQIYNNNLKYIQNINNIYNKPNIPYQFYPQMMNNPLLRQFPNMNPSQIPIQMPIPMQIPMQMYSNPHPSFNQINQPQPMSNYYLPPQQLISPIIPPSNQNMNMLLQQQKLLNPYLFQKIMKNNQKPYLKRK